jgi:cleavage and polyadenylation specificity factor subunit 1
MHMVVRIDIVILIAFVFCTCADTARVIRSILGDQYHQADVELVGLASRFASTRYLARAPSTLAKYRPAWEHFVSWASGLTPPIDPYNASGPVVAMYLHRLLLLSQEDGIGPSRVTNASDAIHSHYFFMGTPSPTDHPLCTVVRDGAQRSLHATPILREAVTAADIRALVDMFLVESAPLSDYMHVTVFLIMYACGLRFEQMVEVLVDSAFLKFYPECALLFIAKSKTDQRMLGRWVACPALGGRYCPVFHLKELLRKGGFVTTPANPGQDCGPLLRRVYRQGQSQILQQVTSSLAHPIPALSYTRLLERCKELCAQAGITRHITLHSFRIGASTEAAEAGATTTMIRLFGGWASDAMPCLYVRNTFRQTMHTARLLGLQS